LQKSYNQGQPTNIPIMKTIALSVVALNKEICMGRLGFQE
jgi:hypothetical protein